MTISSGYRQLATALENLESSGLQVLGVTTTDDERNERLTVDLTVSVPLSPDGTDPSSGQSTATDRSSATDHSTRTDASTATDVREEVLSSLSVEPAASSDGAPDEPTGRESTPDETADPDAADAEPTADGGVVHCPVADCDATFESDHGMKIHRTKSHCLEREADDDVVPAYRDPETLREVFAACDSFTEMRDALETDVSAQTVRRQMIAHGIYEPGTSNADGEATEGSSGERKTREETEEDVEEDVAEDTKESGEEDATASELDAIELPEGVTVADLKAAVSAAKTLYDVQQRFDLDRNEAMQLLEKYDLLNIVHGRVSNREVRKQVDEDEITRRILEHAPVSQAPEV